jgi:hypothetical protein
MSADQASSVELELDIEEYAISGTSFSYNIAQWSRDDPISIRVQHQLNLTRVLCVLLSEQDI